MSIVSVVLDLPKKSPKQILDYLLPEKFKKKAKIGARVIVPLGSTDREGYIIRFLEETEVKNLKNIKELVDEEPIISREMLELAFWVSDFYFCPLHRVLDYILPPNFRLKKEKCYRLKAGENLDIKALGFLDRSYEEVFSFLAEKTRKESFFIKNMGQDALKILRDLEERKIVESFWDFKNKKTRKMVNYIGFLDKEFEKEDFKNAPKQVELFKYMQEKKSIKMADLQKELQVSYSTIDSLVEKGYLKKEEQREVRKNVSSESFYNKKDIQLNSKQEVAVRTISDKIKNNEEAKFLLHGVTGSGKTEIYLHSIKKALDEGKGALVLVPEISLTPQTIGRFQAVLGDTVVVIHSKISEGERQDAWEALKKGKAKVAIGVRSAIFAPVKNLGIIVIDEEHENTFKQSEPDPRYHAREVAEKRIEISQAVLLLGSATPSVESYAKALSGQYQLLELEKRIQEKEMPEVFVVDMREELKLGNKSMFSNLLEEEITRTLKKGEQIILFLNRRGFSTYVFCRECGEVMMCPNCSISLTYHAFSKDLKCHYCNHRQETPKLCPKCKSQFIKYFGAGTQQVEEEFRKKWPDISLLRMDADTTQRKNAHESLLEDFKNQKAQVLIGTQMIAKGLDFPNITLVGVLAADTTLNLPDYKSSERTFQLLTQVAGRSGRGEKKGKVVIQTYSPEHYSIKKAQKHDYKAFFALEREQREMFEYPPYSSLIRLVISGFYSKNVESLSEDIGSYLNQRAGERFEVYGPSPAPIQKIQRRFRWHIILKSKDIGEILEISKKAYRKFSKKLKDKSLRITIDVKPENIL